jgi:hypothetical protein
MSNGADSKQFIPLKFFHWGLIDHRLVMLRMLDLSTDMRKKVEADERRIQFENRLNMNSSTVPSLTLKMKEERADEWARIVYEIYCAVWQTQGYEKSAAFVRAVSAQVILRLLQSRAKAISGQFSKFAKRTRFNAMLTDAYLKSFELRMLRLQSRWQRQLEAEAKECEHLERKKRIMSATKPNSPATNPDRPTPLRQTGSPPIDESRRESIIRMVQNPQTYNILSTPDSACYFGVTERTVHRWKNDGKLISGARRGSITIKSIRQWEKKRSRRLPLLQG